MSKRIITKTRASQRALDLVSANEQLRKLTGIIEHSPSSIVITGADAEIEYVNPAFTRVTGYTLEEALGKNPRILKSGRTPPETFVEMWRAILKGETWRGELCNKRKNGEEFWENTVIAPIFDADGKITHYVAIKEDVTAWKNMEQALRESEKQYRDLYEMESDAIFIVRNRDNAIIEANSAAEILYGYSRAEMLGLHNFDLSAEPQATRQATDVTVPPNQVISIPLRWHHKKDGSIFPAEIMARHFTWKGEEVHIAAIRDISARLQADLRYHTIFEQSHDAIFILDLTGKHTAANKRATEMLGYSQEELLSLSAKDISAQQEQSMGVLARMLDGEQVPLYERIFRHKDGRLVPVEINVELIRDANNKPLFIQSIVRDITERKKAEEELYQSRERYRIVADFTSDWEYWIGSDHALLYISPSVEQMTGYSREEFTENPDLLFQIIHPEDKKAMEHHLHSDVNGMDKESFEIEFRILTKSGETRWISHACTPAHLKDGSYAGRRAGNRDITERKRVEMENANFSRQLENLNDMAIQLSLAPTFDEMCRLAVELGRKKLEFDRIGLWFIDPEDSDFMIGSFGTDEHGNIRDERNIRAPTTPNEVNKKLMEERAYIYHRDNVPVYNEHLEPIGIGDQAGVGLWSDKSIIGFLYIDNFLTHSPIDERKREILHLFGQVIGHQGTIKRTEESLKQLNASLEARVNRRTKQLEETITELEGFSYTVSHNLRSPLRAINGYANLIERELNLPPASEANQHLRHIKTNAQLMGQMMDELLSFIQLGRKTIQKMPVSANLLVQEVLEMLRPQYEGRQVEFIIGELPECQADQGLLRQVFLALINNAIKYSREREIPRIEISWQKGEENKTVYFVRDNGVGFDMRHYPQLFGIFNRLHQEQGFEGTGIGLAFVHRIITRHGGQIWAESKVGEGAKFYFTLE